MFFCVCARSDLFLTRHQARAGRVGHREVVGQISGKLFFMCHLSWARFLVCDRLDLTVLASKAMGLDGIKWDGMGWGCYDMR